MTKVIHVHFLNGRKNYYFGSVRAIYQKFTVKELGCSEDYLRHVLKEDGNIHLSSKACFIRSHLIRTDSRHPWIV